MTEIPVDPDLRAAVLQELDGWVDSERPLSDLADGIIRAINRTMYLKAVNLKAKEYAEFSRHLKPSILKADGPVTQCCCVPVTGTSGTAENIEFPCSKCPYHARYARKRMVCFNHRKQERSRG